MWYIGDWLAESRETARLVPQLVQDFPRMLLLFSFSFSSFSFLGGIVAGVDEVAVLFDPVAVATLWEPPETKNER